ALHQSQAATARLPKKYAVVTSMHEAFGYMVGMYNVVPELPTWILVETLCVACAPLKFARLSNEVPTYSWIVDTRSALPWIAFLICRCSARNLRLFAGVFTGMCLPVCRPRTTTPLGAVGLGPRTDAWCVRVLAACA